MNITFLCEFATLNGGEQSMVSTLEPVRSAGHQISVIAPAEGDLADLLHSLGIKVIPFEFHDSCGTRIAQDILRQNLAVLLKMENTSILHSNSLSMSRLAGPVAAKLGVPSIAHIRDIIRISKRAMQDVNCNDRILAVSRAAAMFHIANGASAEKMHVLYNGVDLDRFRPRKATGYIHRILGLEDQPLIGNIGQIGLRKGQDVLARAAFDVASRFPDVHYLFIGSRFSQKTESLRYEADLHAAATGPLKDRFHFLGFRDDIDLLLPELTLLVHAAHQEPLGRVLLEAAACGVPIIATDVGGTREIFPDGKDSAFLVPPNDAGSMANAIIRALSDSGCRASLSIASRKRAEEEFSLDRAVAGILRHYAACS